MSQTQKNTEPRKKNVSFCFVLFCFVFFVRMSFPKVFFVSLTFLVCCMTNKITNTKTVNSQKSKSNTHIQQENWSILSTTRTNTITHHMNTRLINMTNHNIFNFCVWLKHCDKLNKLEDSFWVWCLFVHWQLQKQEQVSLNVDKWLMLLKLHKQPKFSSKHPILNELSLKHVEVQLESLQHKCVLLTLHSHFHNSSFLVKSQRLSFVLNFFSFVAKPWEQLKVFEFVNCARNSVFVQHKTKKKSVCANWKEAKRTKTNNLNCQRDLKIVRTSSQEKFWKDKEEKRHTKPKRLSKWVQITQPTKQNLFLFFLDKWRNEMKFQFSFSPKQQRVVFVFCLPDSLCNHFFCLANFGLTLDCLNVCCVFFCFVLFREFEDWKKLNARATQQQQIIFLNISLCQTKLFRFDPIHSK